MEDRRIYAGYCRPFVEDELSTVRRFLIADVYARFLRAQGGSEALRLAVECSNDRVELEADRRGKTPRDVLDEYLARLRDRFEGLQIALDFDRVVLGSERAHRLRTQQAFLQLLAAGAVYEREQGDRARWVAATSRLAEQCDPEAETLLSWSAEAVEAQRTALGRVDGVEVRAILPGAGDLVVFTPFGDSIAQATFVAVSPYHPQVEALATPAERAQLSEAAGELPIVQTSLRAAVPAVEALLPLVLTPAVDARFGPTAVLGMPSRDDVDRKIDAQLRPVAPLAWGTVRFRSDIRPARRYRLADICVSREGRWGIPVPIMRCADCGTVPVDPSELPIEPYEPDEELACVCPRCGGAAHRDGASIASSFVGMWMWPSICSAEGRDWPECQVIWSSEAVDELLQQRLAHILAGLDRIDSDGARKPFASLLMHGSLNGEKVEGAINSGEALDEYVTSVGSDAARLAILTAGSPPRPTHLRAHLLCHAERFIERVRKQIDCCEGHFASARIDRSVRSRRRLSAWSRIAKHKVAMHVDALEMHKAAYDIECFQRRIEAFEDLCGAKGGIAEADREAIAWALIQFGRISEPLMPHLAAELSTRLANEETAFG